MTIEIVLSVLCVASAATSAVAWFNTERRVRAVEAHVAGAGPAPSQLRHATLAEFAAHACAFVDEQAATRVKRNQPPWSWQDKHHAAVDWFEHAARAHEVKTDRGEVERYLGAHLGQRRRAIP